MFGLSGSKSKSRSSGFSQASSFNFADAASRQGSTSGSVSGGTSRSRAENAARGESRQRIAFEDVFARLYNGAELAAANLDPSMLTQASNDLFSSGLDFIGQLGGDAGTEFLQNRLAAGDQLADQQIAALQSDVGRLFSEELNPAITSEAVAGGQLGGGRQGVAQGVAAGRVADVFAQGAADIRARNQAQLDELAAGVAARNLQGAQTGLAGGQGLMNLAQMGFGAGFQPVERLAAILGGPTTLTDATNVSRGFSGSDAVDFARAFSESFGESASRSRGGSQSTSRTESSSSGRSFGFTPVV